MFVLDIKKLPQQKQTPPQFVFSSFLFKMNNNNEKQSLLSNGNGQQPQIISQNGAAASSSQPMITPQEPTVISGYEDVTSESNVLMAPTQKNTSQPQVDRSANTQTDDFTIDDALAAMEAHASDSCCLRGGITRELTVTRMDTMSAVVIVFESSTEGRSTTTAAVPHRQGSHVDGPQNGQPPQPWDIEAHPSRLFANERREIEVPHTSTVTDCDRCFRRGTISCKQCGGQGSNNCHRCHGSGAVTVTHHDHGHHGHHSHHHHHHHSHGHHHNHRETCHSCHGSGRRTCSRCNGKGFVTCPTCDGTGYLRCFIRLDIQWKKYEGKRVLSQSALPDNLIMNAGGATMFHEEDFVIRPISHLPQQEVNDAANKLIAEQQIPNVERLLRQRIEIRRIPVYEVHYTYKGSDPRRFWVYGTERQVYEDGYPSWCCAIL
mmetsp:Transcript_11954/g.18040  ORF Transcript_11954/g.18040 Transcript_11954/m.18040 type:complete len:432 (+) Transcript_11954:1861-3156(+)